MVQTKYEGDLDTKSDNGDEDKFKVDFGSPTNRLNGVREEQKKTLRFLQNCVALYWQPITQMEMSSQQLAMSLEHRYLVSGDNCIEI